jgi:hypothetical protein
MKKNGKLLIAAAVMALAVDGLYADPLTNTSSPQSDVTRGKSESNADYFMSVRNYANMDFDKWWGAIAYKVHIGEKTYSSNELAQLGFATRFGSLYTALSYRGSGWRDFGSWFGSAPSVHSYTEKTIDGKTWKVFDSEPNLDTTNYRLRNEADVLLGFADMGFKLYYVSNHQSNSAADYVVGTTYYKSLQEGYGHINPGIAWGMTRALIPGRGIKPQINIDLDFCREYRMHEEFTNPNRDPLDPNPYDPGESRGTQILFSNNRFIPGIDIGMGAFTLTTVDNFSLDVDLDYGIKLHLYENDYTYQDAAGKYQIKTLSGGRLHRDAGIADIFEINHSLTPSISADWSGDRLRLACRLGLPMTAYIKNEMSKSLNPAGTDGSLVKTGDSRTTEYTLKPMLDLAMQWEIVPSRLFLNAGGALGIFEATFNTVDKKYYVNGVVDETNPQRGKQRYNRFEPAATNLYLGVTFFLIPNMELQAALGVGSNNNINVFDTGFNNTNGRGGLINFGNILVSLKF